MPKACAGLAHTFGIAAKLPLDAVFAIRYTFHATRMVKV
jgi:hypothetical protein